MGDKKPKIHRSLNFATFEALAVCVIAHEKPADLINCSLVKRNLGVLSLGMEILLCNDFQGMIQSHRINCSRSQIQNESQIQMHTWSKSRPQTLAQNILQAQRGQGRDCSLETSSKPYRSWEEHDHAKGNLAVRGLLFQ